jgi:predicted ATPase
MINQLRLKNFKSWADTGDLRLAPLTCFFGTNSSGKSSILQALLLLKQTAESNERPIVLQTGGNRGYVNLGTIAEIIHNGIRETEMELGVAWDSKTSVTVFPDHDESYRDVTKIALNTTVFHDGSKNYVKKLTYRGL